MDEIRRPAADAHPELLVDPDVSRPMRPLHLQLPALAAVLVGGVSGASARYGVGLLLPPVAGTWPVATFSVNMVGAFVLGLLLEGLARSGPDRGARRTLRLLIGTGFIGAFTTYSTLAVDTARLLRSGHVGLAFTYAGGSVIAGLIVAGCGIALAAAIHTRRSGEPIGSLTNLLLPPAPDGGHRR